MESALAAYLAAHIPMAGAMDLEVVVASPERVLLRAPLEPNLNHRGTAFGGSIGSLAILAGWSWLWVILRERARGPTLVIREARTEYLRPIPGAFSAETRPPDDEAFARFLAGLDRHGSGKIELTAEILAGGEIAARFTGLYVALLP